MPKSSCKTPPHSPHDALFKWTFSQRKHAVGLLKATLPAPVVEAVRWGSLRVEKSSFVNPALRSRYSDLVLSAQMGKGKGEGRIYFYTLIEHQRDVEALMVLRMGMYVMRLWEQIVSDQPELAKVPPIMPILLHHSDTGWTAATAFHDIIAGDGPERAALLPHIPSFTMRLIDVSGGRAGDLVEQALTALGKVVLWCLSVAGDDARLEQEIQRVGDALDEVLRAPNGLAALEALLRYLVATHERFSVEKVGTILKKAAGPRAQEDVVTVLDEIERRGELRGELRGRAQGRALTLLELLEARFGAVPSKAREQILAADEPTLTTWTARVLSAPTLDDVLGESGVRASTAPRPPTHRPPRRV